MIRALFLLVLVVLFAPFVYAHASSIISIEIARSVTPERVNVFLENDSLACTYDFDEDVLVTPVYSWYENGLLAGIASNLFHNPVPGSNYVCSVLFETDEFLSYPKNSSFFAYTGESFALFSDTPNPSPLTGFAVLPVSAQRDVISSKELYLPVVGLLVILNSALLANIIVLVKRRK